jgi:elongation factor Ts
VSISASAVKELRDKTNAGMMDCKKALIACNGDSEKAIDWLRQRGLSMAAKRADRQSSEGQVMCYVHGGGKLGVMVEVNCETDFTGKTDEFVQFSRDVAMQIAAANPVCIAPEDMPEALLRREKDIYLAQVKESGKPEKLWEKIVEGKVQKFFSEACLLQQAFVKDPDKTVEDLLNEMRAKTGENVRIRRFVRFALGETSQEA